MDRTSDQEGGAPSSLPRRGERYSGWPPGHLERFADRDEVERSARERAAVSLGFGN
jgi:hypothetical protein